MFLSGGCGDEATLEFTQVVGQIQYFVIITIVPVCLLAVS